MQGYSSGGYKSDSCLYSSCVPGDGGGVSSSLVAFAGPVGQIGICRLSVVPLWPAASAASVSGGGDATTSRDAGGVIVGVLMAEAGPLGGIGIGSVAVAILDCF